MEESSKRMLCDKLLKYNKEQKLVEKKLESIEEELRVQANDNKLAENSIFFFNKPKSGGWPQHKLGKTRYA